ncbi:MAG TPA: LysR family transcriptional regulator [Planctomycetaceae bacterium]|nr:LysR family transcriptional regulator [Planctomycetaceae bacterium]
MVCPLRIGTGSLPDPPQCRFILILRLMQLRFVEIFCAVVEERSFSKGARAQSVTQSAASQAVSNLERKLGTLLIDRSKRPFELTPAGQIYYDGCRRILAEYREIEGRVRGTPDRVIGRVRVAAIYSVGLLQMERFARKFEEQYPDVALRLEYQHPDRVYEQVLSEQADLGLVSYPRPRADLVCLPWQDQPMVLVCATEHQLALRSRIEPADLNGVPLIAFTPELPIRREIDQWLRRQRVEVNQLHEFDNIETIKQAVQCGTGVSLLPLATVNKEVTLHSLVAIPLGGEPLSRPLGIIHRKHRQLTPPVLKLIEHLRLELGTTPVTAAVPAESTDAATPAPVPAAVGAKRPPRRAPVINAPGINVPGLNTTGANALGANTPDANAVGPVAKASRKPG